MRVNDYESMGVLSAFIKAKPPVLEAYSGTSIVQWYGSIEGQLARKEEEYRAAKNPVVADRVHTFLQTWRDNEISGSINVETLDILNAAATQNAVDDWQMSDYFRNLRDALRALKASQEELPMTAATPQRRRLSPRDGPRGLGGKKPEDGAPPEGAPEETGGAPQSGTPR